MGELAPWHIIIVALVILLVFGAKRIPDLARSLGSGMREFKQGVSGMVDEHDVEPPATPQVTASVADAPADVQHHHAHDDQRDAADPRD